MVRKTFEKLPASRLQTVHPQRLFELVAKHIVEFIDGPTHEAVLRNLEPLPMRAKTVYWLWRFQCEAGICGMDQFVLDSLDIPQTHAALKEVGAGELVCLLEAGVPLARKGPAEFSRLKDQTWYAQFKKSKRYTDLQELNAETFSLQDQLTKLVAAYVKVEAAVFFES